MVGVREIGVALVSCNDDDKESKRCFLSSLPTCWGAMVSNILVLSAGIDSPG